MRGATLRGFRPTVPSSTPPPSMLSPLHIYVKRYKPVNPKRNQRKRGNHELREKTYSHIGLHGLYRHADSGCGAPAFRQVAGCGAICTHAQGRIGKICARIWREREQGCAGRCEWGWRGVCWWCRLRQCGRCGRWSRAGLGQCRCGRRWRRGGARYKKPNRGRRCGHSCKRAGGGCRRACKL